MPAPALGVWCHRPGSGNDFLDVMRTLGGRYYDENGTLVFNEEGVKRFFQFIYDAANTLEITPHDLSQQGWPAINKMAGDGTSFAYYGRFLLPPMSLTRLRRIRNDLCGRRAFMMFPVSQSQ